MRGFLVAALILGAASANASTIYNADFSQIVSIDHDTIGNALEASPAAGANFTIGYTGSPASDTTRNFFETDGDSLISNDFGGSHFMFTDTINVLPWSSISIGFLASFLGVDAFNNTPTEFIEYVYQLDGGAEQSIFSFTGAPNAANLNATALVDVSAASSLVVRLRANVDGFGDGFDLTALTVEGLEPAAPSVVPLPAGLPLMLTAAGALWWARRQSPRRAA